MAKYKRRKKKTEKAYPIPPGAFILNDLPGDSRPVQGGRRSGKPLDI